ncbi:MAG: lipid-A-disaccharide synthase [Armatimonadetes bacterium]|nr:lipid-A-disaccharide synthase [Armatimonadota bacterium]
MYKIFIISAEVSGDVQGAQLAIALKKEIPNLEVSGIGGIRMQNSGVKLLFNSSNWGAIGFIEAFKKIPGLLFKLLKIKKHILTLNPNLVIFIDAPAINLRLAEFTKKNKIKSLYFFPPSAWSENLKKARYIAGLVDYIVPVFPFTVNTYKKAGIKVYYFGHPLIDRLNNVNKNKLNHKLANLPEDCIPIGIFPGSRAQEIKFLLPIILKSAHLIIKKLPKAHFILPLASINLKNLIYKFTENNHLPLTIVNSPLDAMKIAKLLILASGSASLEAAYFLNPMIILYKLHYLDYFFSKLWVKIPFMGLPNLIYGEEIVPELLQKKANPVKISKLALKILNNEEEQIKIKQNNLCLIIIKPKTLY